MSGLRIILGFLHLTLVISAPSVPTAFSSFTFQPAFEVVKSPVTKLETISLPTITQSVPSASAVAIAGGSLPVVQRVESYTSGDSGNSEIRDLLRTLLNELRSQQSKSSAITAPGPLLSDYGAPAQIRDTYGPPSQLRETYGPPRDSYSTPPRNTVFDSNAPTYPDSFDNNKRDKPEKVRQEKQSLVTSTIAESPIQYREIVRTVYQPVYVPYQYAQPEYLTYAQPVTQTVPYVSAVPTRVKTGASAVAISTIHSSPAYALQQQQLSLPLVQSYPTLTSDSSSAVVDVSSDGYQ